MSIAIEAAGLSETQRQIVDLAREFARTRIEPHAAEWDRTAHFARDVLDELGKLGFLGMSTPEEAELAELVQHVSCEVRGAVPLRRVRLDSGAGELARQIDDLTLRLRSEERRVGEEWRS